MVVRRDGNAWLTRAEHAVVIVAALILAACMRHSALLKYGSARNVTVRERRPGVLFVSGGTIHSGSCVDRVTQERDGTNVTIVVKLVPAKGPCAGEFFSLVSTSGVNTINLGIPGSNDPKEFGPIWSRDHGARIWCPPVCSGTS